MCQKSVSGTAISDPSETYRRYEPSAMKAGTAGRPVLGNGMGMRGSSAASSTPAQATRSASTRACAAA